MLLSPLLPNVLMSNIIGDFVNRRECLRILIRFQNALKEPEALRHDDNSISSSNSRKGVQGARNFSTASLIEPVPSLAESSDLDPAGNHSRQPIDDSTLEAGLSSKLRTTSYDDSSLQDRLDDDDYFNSLAWSGGIYSYRPQKNLFNVGVRDNPPYHLGFVACLPVLLAFTVAFYILWRSPPPGISCRHFVIIAAFLSWCVSPVLTWLIARMHNLSHKIRWYCTISKDAFFALPILILIIGSSCGMFNSCYCFSGIFMFGFKGARVPLNTDPLYYLNYWTIYPAMVSVCLGLQIFVIPGWIWRIGRSGLRIMQWNEKDRMAALQASLQEESVGVAQRPASQLPRVPPEARHRQDSDVQLLGEFNLPVSPGYEMDLLNR
jgi:hypothetical protein